MAWTDKNLNRSYCCNVELLQFLRDQKGWTQSQLAAKSGYSERLISKAESGKPISIAAIDVLAQTLTSEKSVVYPEDLITDVLQLAKRFVKCSYHNSTHFFDSIRQFLDDDIEFIFAGDVSEIPFAGRHCGLEEAKRAFDILYSVIEPPENFDEEPHFRYAVSGNEVFITGHTWMHPIGRPTPPIEIAMQMKFRRGKLFFYQDWLDTSAGAKILQIDSAATDPVREKP